MVLGGFIPPRISTPRTQTNAEDEKWQPEFAHPYHILEPHASIIVASPAGGEAPLDQSSVDNFKDKISQDFLKTNEKLYKDTRVLSGFIGHASEFEAIYFVGGHGREFLFQLVGMK